MRGAGAALALALLAGCTGGGEQPHPAPSPPRPEGEAVVGVLGEPATLDPYAPAASDLTWALVRPVLPSLYALAPTGEPVPDLAGDVTPVAGGVRVALAPRRWSDGRPVTARDVVLSARRARPPSGFHGLTVRADGGRAVVIEGHVRHWPRRLARLTYVLPGGRFRPEIAGGAYRIVRRTPGLGLVYEPNPEAEPPGLRRVSVRYVAEVAIMLELLEDGRLDAAAVPSGVNLDGRLRALGLQVGEALGWERVVLALDPERLSLPVRNALAAALARARAAAVLLGGDGRPAFTAHPQPGPGGAKGPWERPAGRGSPGLVRLATAEGDELLELTARALQAMLERAGFTVEPIVEEARLVYGPWREGGSPAGAVLLRLAGAPGLGGRRAGFTRRTTVPLFHTETLLAHVPGLAGPVVNPTLDGPLWNLAAWRFEDAP